MSRLQPLIPLLVATILFGACSSDLLGGPPSDVQETSVRPPAQRCNALLTQPTDTATVASITVLLADGSASGFTRTDGPRSRQDWATVLGQRLPQNGHDLVAMGLFGGAVNWRFQWVTAGKSTDAARTRNDMRDVRGCLIGALSDAMSSPPDKPQTDVLRALAESAEYMRNRLGPKSIYIATDGLSNTGCADLRAAPIGDLTAIPDLVQNCKPELPTLGKDYTVHFLGIGNSANGWSDVKTPQRTWMQKFWKALCVATGATCADPSSAAPGSIPAPDANLPVDADVTMPAITTKPGNPTVLSVPASILFDIDKYSLANDRAQDALEQVMTFLKSVRYTKIVIAGHTDSTGTPEHNRELSLNRADAVAEFLRSQHFTNITTVGYGPTRPACMPEYNNGQPDRINMACNRRVEILVYT